MQPVYRVFLRTVLQNGPRYLADEYVRLYWTSRQFLHPFGEVPFLPSIDSPPSRSFLLCATSQLYTRAKATSSVVICSRRNSMSSSHVSRLFLAVSSLDLRSCSASGIGYASMTFAPSHRYTSSVGGISAFAYNVSLSSNVVSMASASACAKIQPWFFSSMLRFMTHLSAFQKAYSFQRLLNIWYLVLETDRSPLRVLLHELVFSSFAMSDIFPSSLSTR